MCEHLRRRARGKNNGVIKKSLGVLNCILARIHPVLCLGGKTLSPAKGSSDAPCVFDCWTCRAAFGIPTRHHTLLLPILITSEEGATEGQPPGDCSKCAHAHLGRAHSLARLRMNWACTSVYVHVCACIGSYAGLAKTLYIRCIYGILGREITKYAAHICCVYTVPVNSTPWYIW
jgi:hypothetical protein